MDEGYWGKSDVTLDWCEPNYLYTQYVAEFWNTISSIPIILLPIFGFSMYLKHTKFSISLFIQEIHCFLPLFLTFFIGIGSFLYHGTLRRFGQVLDELPMIIWLYSVLYELINIKKKNNFQYGSIIIYACIIHSILYFVLNDQYILFLSTFVILCSLVINYLMNEIVYDFIEYINYINMYTWVLFVFWISIILWCIENLCCNSCFFMKSLNLHAIWHLGGAYVFYMFDIGIIFLRGYYLKYNPQFKLFSINCFQIYYLFWKETSS